MTLGVQPWVVLWAAVWMVGVNGQADGSFWWLNTTPSPTPKIRCQCVPYYVCVDGVISTSGEGVIDVRSGGSNGTEPVVNVEKCPDVIEICCGLPDGANGSHSSSSPLRPLSPVPASSVTTVLPPDTPCNCVPLSECKDPARLVSDGKGNTSLALFGTTYSHSKCTGAFEVCCAPLESTAQPLEEHQCICVPRTLCGADGHVITDGTGLLDPRFGPGVRSSSPLASGACRNPNDVCCLPPSSSFSTTPAPSRGSCGWRNFGGVRVRILGFTDGESQFGEFPWVAAVLKAMSKTTPNATTPNFKFVGGGTLIHPRVVLTAAHKVYRESANELKVRVGEWDTQGKTEPYPHQDRRVSKVVVHEGFDAATLFYDVALLFLEEEVVLGPHINTICLAQNTSQVDWKGCVTNGWGVNAFGTTQYQEIMKSLTLPLVGSGACQNSLRRTRLGRFFRLHPTFLCAGGEAGKDACKGDGGGPLACPQLADPKGHYLLVGLTAWGVGCGREGLPGVYVNIPKLYAWITATLDLHLTPGGRHTGI